MLGFPVFWVSYLSYLYHFPEGGLDMSAEAAILTRSWRVAGRTCTLSVPRPEPGKALSACMEWEPSPPKSMTAEDWRAYRAGRNAALAEVAAELNIAVAVVEV